MTLVQRFITVPVKRTIPPTVNTKSPHGLLQKDVDALALLRNAVLQDFDRIHACGTSCDTTSALGSEQSRTDFLAGLLAKVEAYETGMQAAAAKCPAFATGIFFFWQASLTERLNHAFDDMRFEFASIRFNVGATYMNIAASVVLAAPSGQLQGVFEKEAYGYLLSAAGHLELAESMMTHKEQHPAGSAPNGFTEDAKPAFMAYLKLIALAQAQEIGTSKMLQSEASKHKDINAKLCRQAADLYRVAEQLAGKSIVTFSPAMDGVKAVVAAKAGVLEALTLSMFASTKVDSDMPVALLLLTACQEKLQVLSAPGGTKKDRSAASDLTKLPYGVPVYFTSVAKWLEHNQLRIQQINSLVTRAKVSPDALPPLPAAQELARPKPASLPMPLTVAAASAGEAAVVPPSSAAAAKPGDDGWVDVGKK